MGCYRPSTCSRYPETGRGTHEPVPSGEGVAPTTSAAPGKAAAARAQAQRTVSGSVGQAAAPATRSNPRCRLRKTRI